MVDIRINQTLQTGAVRKPHLPGGESVSLFLESTIVSRIIHQIQVVMSRQTSLRQPLQHLLPRVQSAR